MLLSALAFTVAAEETPLTIESVVIAGENQLLITFSEPAEISSLLPFMGIRLHASSDASSAGVTKIDINGKLEYGQFESQSIVAVEGSNKKQYLWTLATPTGLGGYKSVYEIAFQTAESLKPYEHLNGWFCIEEKEFESDGKTAKNSNVDDVCSIYAVSDNTKTLRATKKGSAKGWSGSYTMITIDPDVYMPEIPGAVPSIKKEEVRDITVKNVIIANEKQLVLEFSENVSLYVPEGEYLSGAIKYVNKASNATIYADINSDSKREYLQSMGICEVYDNKLVWTATGEGALADRSIKDILEKTGLITIIPADPENGTPEEIVDVISGAKSWKIAFAFEGMADERIPFPFEGYINNIRSTDDEFGILKANKLHSFDAAKSSLIIDLAKDATEKENGDLPYAENIIPGVAELEVTGATILNDHQIELSFAEEIAIASVPDPYVALCYVDKDGNIVRIDSDGDGMADEDLVFDGFIYVESNKLVWTKLDTELLTLKQMFEKTGFDTEEGYEDWKLCLYILENQDQSAGEDAIYKPGVLDSVISIDAEKMLYGTRVNVGPDGEVIAYADEFFLDLSDIDGKENIEVVYTPPVIEPIYPETMTILDGRQIEIVFSSPIKLITEEMPLAYIRYTDENNNLIYVDKDGTPDTRETPLQFAGTLKERSGKLVFILDDGLVLKDILEKKGYESTEGSADWLVQFCIEDHQNPHSSAIKQYQLGFIDAVTAVEGLGLLAANKPNEQNYAADGFYFGEFDGIENVENKYYPYRPISIVSVEIINEKQIEITFSEEVKIVGEGSQPVFAGLRYTDKSNGLVYARGPMQAYGSLSQETDDKTKLQWSANGGELSGKKFSQVIDKSTYTDIEGYEDWLVQFCFEGMPCSLISDPLLQYVDNIQSLDGEGRLYGNAPNGGKVYDGYYFSPITGVENENIPYLPGGKIAMEPTKIEIINEKQIAITFPVDVQIVGENSVFVGLRFVDKNNDLIYVDTDGDGKKEPMQSYGNSVARGNQIIFTPTGGHLSAKSYAALLEKKGFEQFEGYENWTLALCIEGMPASNITSPIQGYIDNVQGVDGKHILVANKPGGGVYDGYYGYNIEGKENADKPYVPVVIRPEWPEDTREGVEVVSVKILNNTQIQVKFSEPVKMAGTKSPWVCIRYVQYDNTGRPSYATYKNKEGKNMVMQFGGSLVLNGTDTCIWTLTAGDTMSDIVNMKACEGKGTGYDLMFCIEGYPDPAIKNPELAYIDNIVSKDGKRKLKGLFAARDLAKNPDGSWRGEYDGLYVPITGIENANKRWEPPYHASLSLQSIKVLNAFQLELTFSDPVKVVGNANLPVFTAIRYTDKDFNVIKDDTGYLQWMGTLNGNGTNVVKWNLSSNSSKTLEELLNMKGYERSGYRLTFCIEGLPADANLIPKTYLGYIDNIQSVDGKKLLKSTYKKWDGDTKRAIYDGYYHTKFLNIENAANSSVEKVDLVGVEVESVRILSDYELQIKFSEPVKLIGEGTAATQYCPVYAGIRFTDMNLTTQSYAGKLLDFPGDFYLTDGDDTATWEMRSKEFTIKELLEKTEYRDFIANFCIEGTEDTTEIPDPQPGYVDNIRNMDDTYLLVATKGDLFGVSDGFYTSEILEREKDPNVIEKVESDLIDLLNMTNAEREAFKALSVEEHNALVGGAQKLLDEAQIGTLPEGAWKTYLKVLEHNKLALADVKSYLVALGASHDAKYPLSVTFNISDMQFGPEDMIYVYRINEDGTVDQIQKVTATVDSDGNVKNVKFMTSKFADFFITNRALDTNLPKLSLPIIIGAGVGLLAIIAIIIAIIAKKKKKK